VLVSLGRTPASRCFLAIASPVSDIGLFFLETYEYETIWKCPKSIRTSLPNKIL
jgi:hypothetical protein